LNTETKLTLRQRAEKVFLDRTARSHEHLDAVSSEDLRTILHELRVHQIELELQNDELRRSQAELMSSQARYFDLYDLAPVGYLTIGVPGLILQANLTASSFLGISRAALVQRPISSVILKEDQDAYYLLRKKLLETGAPQACALRMVKPEGAEFWAQMDASLGLDERGQQEIRVVLSDITARKAMEGRLSESLAAAESATRAKSEFLAVMSHELRNPLNGVIGFAELLTFTLLDDEQKGYAQSISSNGKLLLSIINDTLDFSSIERGLLEIAAEPIALRELVEQSVQSSRQAAASKGLQFRCEIGSDVPALITGDARRISQILLNLLGNAVKFTAGGSVSLRVATSCPGGCPALDFSVQDTGPGISADAQTRLFHLFTQADASINLTFGGTGLGLAISRRLAEAMGGTIEVSSAPGNGSTFTFRLPLP